MGEAETERVSSSLVRLPAPTMAEEEEVEEATSVAEAAKTFAQGEKEVGGKSVASPSHSVAVDSLAMAGS